MEELKIYSVSDEYIEYLRKEEPNVLTEYQKKTYISIAWLLPFQPSKTKLRRLLKRWSSFEIKWAFTVC